MTKSPCKLYKFLFTTQDVALVKLYISNGFVTLKSPYKHWRPKVCTLYTFTCFLRINARSEWVLISYNICSMKRIKRK